MTAAITPEPITLEPDTSEPNKSTQRRALFTPSILAGRQFAREVERASEQRVAALERVESAHADRIERLLSQYRTEIQRQPAQEHRESNKAETQAMRILSEAIQAYPSRTAVLFQPLPLAGVGQKAPPEMNDAMARAEAARRKYVYAGTKNPTLAGFAFFITGELMQLSMWVADKLPYQIVRLVFLPLTDASHRIAMYLSREHR